MANSTAAAAPNNGLIRNKQIFYKVAVASRIGGRWFSPEQVTLITKTKLYNIIKLDYTTNKWNSSHLKFPSSFLFVKRFDKTCTHFSLNLKKEEESPLFIWEEKRPDNEVGLDTVISKRCSSNKPKPRKRPILWALVSLSATWAQVHTCVRALIFLIIYNIAGGKTIKRKMRNLALLVKGLLSQVINSSCFSKLIISNKTTIADSRFLW